MQDQPQEDEIPPDYFSDDHADAATKRSPGSTVWIPMNSQHALQDDTRRSRSNSHQQKSRRKREVESGTSYYGLTTSHNTQFSESTFYHLQPVHPNSIPTHDMKTLGVDPCQEPGINASCYDNHSYCVSEDLEDVRRLPNSQQRSRQTTAQLFLPPKSRFGDGATQSFATESLQLPQANPVSPLRGIQSSLPRPSSTALAANNSHRTRLQSQAVSTAVCADVHDSGDGDVLRRDDVQGSSDVMTGGPEDLTDLECLDNDILLERLKTRFLQQQPYTYVGDSLVAVNPCKKLPIYSAKVHKKYRDLSVRSSEAAHIFWVSVHLYRMLRTTGASQCVIVSGDSGSGKTESTKYILHHLVQNGLRSQAAARRSHHAEERSRISYPDIVDKLEKVNPLLELFGNASTVLNENSSRFGKMVELEYDKEGRLVTARVECFTLEKFRVTSRNRVEKNFHVFYALFAGLSHQRLYDLGLDLPAESYRILTPSDTTQAVWVSGEEEEGYRTRCEHMHSLLQDVGFQEEETSSLLKVLAAILLLSNVEFENNTDGDVDTVTALSYMGQLCLDRAMEVLGLSHCTEEMANCLTHFHTVVNGNHLPETGVASGIDPSTAGGETVVARPKTLRQAEEGRDSLARELYATLFYGILDKVNGSLRHGSQLASSSRNACIRLLDISGFENVEGHNGFEQFIINSSNEKLQQFFLQQTLRQEMEEYRLEGLGLPGVDVELTDNVEIVQLIFAKRQGLIPLLEDTVTTNGTDQHWLTKCQARSPPSAHFLVKPCSTFSLSHFAGQVLYTAEDFVKKNSDTLPGNLREVVLRSDNVFIQDYFLLGSDAAAALHCLIQRAAPLLIQDWSRLIEKVTEFAQSRTVRSLSGMMNKLQTSSPVFVRQQLLGSGLLEVTKVRKEGYPIRIKFAHFVTRYKELLEHDDVSTLTSDEELRQVCQHILSSAGITSPQMGVTKVFLKIQQREMLDKARDQKVKRDCDEDDVSIAATEPVSISANDSSSESGFGSGRIRRTGADAKKEHQDVCITMDEDGGKGTGQKKKRKEGRKTTPAYNVFRVTEREAEEGCGEVEMRARRGVRGVLYVLLFALILGGGVVGRMALLWLSSTSFQNIPDSDLWLLTGRDRNPEARRGIRQGLAATQLMLCQLLPLLITWLTCVFRVMFGRRDWPSFRFLVLVTAVDCVGVAGRSVFLFRVLPNTDLPDVLTALILGSAVCQVPAVLKLTSQPLTVTTPHRDRERRSPSRQSDAKVEEEEDKKPNAQSHQNSALRSSRGLRVVTHYVHVLGLAVAAVVQVGAVAVLQFGDSIVSAVSQSPVPLRQPALWAVLLASLASSLSWWENYAHGRSRENPGDANAKRYTSWRNWFALRMEMRLVRQTSFVCTGPAQMVVLLVLFFTMAEKEDDDVDVIQQLGVLLGSLRAGLGDVEVLTSHVKVYGLMYLQLFSSVVTPFLASLACRLYMQRVAFAAPLVLVLPACLLLSCLCTPAGPVPWYDVTERLTFKADVTDPRVLFLLVVGAAVWLSVLVINTHVWFPEVERLAKIDRLFTFPHRDPVFLDVGLQCSRRQDRKENAQWKRHYRKEKEEEESHEGGEVPTVYLCATMWHETRQEMLQALKSLFRIDLDAFSRKKAVENFKIREEYSDLYNPEIHIIFDDAFRREETSGQRVVNSWVTQFVETLHHASRSVNKLTSVLKPPTKTPTPYGGRLLWKLPGGTRMYVHLKDKTLIRPRKRWSQILYLYYLLGFRLMSEYGTAEDLVRGGGVGRTPGKAHRVRKNSSLLNDMPPEVVRKAHNTFIMTLDGDVDFRPESVHLLLDRMKKSKEVAAVCGRIHPKGSGPMVWYQQFEYAIGHWLQKASEHVFGCVLCCPGCFSLFRGSALMDDNVLGKYTTEPTEAVHYIQCEQGEDRWLCTLLLQQGWRIEYCAGADALTFVPETFHDFYIQRRRWSPSTLANVMDLVGSWRATARLNDNISVMFMLYQFVLTASSIVSPGLVVYMIAESYHAVLDTGLWESYVLSVLPVSLFVLLCLRASTDTQIRAAAFLSAVYAVVMLLVTVGTIINVSASEITSPDVLFLAVLLALFAVAGLLHPNELFCLFHGLLYFLTVPSTFVFLTVFFLCNLHVVSWGTREGGPDKADSSSSSTSSSAQEDEEKVPPLLRRKGKLYRLFEKLGLPAVVRDLRSFAVHMVGVRQEEGQQGRESHEDARSSSEGCLHRQTPRLIPNEELCTPEKTPTPPLTPPKPVAPKPEPVPRVEPDRAYWVRHLDLPGSRTGEVSRDESDFWQFLIREFLLPLNDDKEHKDKIAADLLRHRNNVVFAYMLLNLMFTLCLLQLKVQTHKLKDTFYIAGKYEPVSTVSLGVFSLLLLTQFLGMLGHRWGTLLHLVAFTSLSKERQEAEAEDAISELHKLTTSSDTDILDNAPCSDDDDDSVNESPTAPSSISDPHTPSSSRHTLSDIDEIPDYPDTEEEEEEEAAPLNQLVTRRVQTVKRHFQKRHVSGRRFPPWRYMADGSTRSREFQQYSRRQHLYMNTLRGAPPAYRH
ncbi:uncharacterized protein LOC143282270 [Babylonia areolata]|uniref:uncharacterized protein LOC143282270 n=1 Tax=Babylonia areolata TaxID=304850 RepID=UPI003FD3E41A